MHVIGCAFYGMIVRSTVSYSYGRFNVLYLRTSVSVSIKCGSKRETNCDPGRPLEATWYSEAVASRSLNHRLRLTVIIEM